MPIPKIIHQIWIGPKNPPTSLIDTWKMEGWEHNLWREEDINSLDMTNRSLYDYFYKKGVRHGSADVARIEILRHYGGIYIDADTKRLGALEGNFLDSDFFAVEGNRKDGLPYRIANGIVGSVPEHPIIVEYINRMGKAKKVEPAWCTIGGTMLTQVIKHFKDDRTVILEPYWFYPQSSWGQRHEKADLAIAEHYWNSEDYSE